MPNYIIGFLIALVIVLAITPIVMKLAIYFGAMDKPEQRKVHKKPIPRLGGVAIYIAFMIAVCPFIDYRPELIGLLIGGTIIMLVGVVDDFISLPAKVKLLGQIVAAAVLVFFGIRIDFITNPFGNFIFLEYLAVPVTIFWVVGITNTVNLIDGLDGLAAGISTIATITIMLIALQDANMMVALLAAALAGATLGFLYYNFNPARIFMGDTGSMFLGYVFATISILGMVKSAATIAFIVPILAIGLPILDTTFAIVRRYRGGIPIFKPDKGHLHHRLLAMGFSQRQAVLLMYIFSAFLGVAAIALTKVSLSMAILIVIFVVAVILIGAKKLGVFSLNNNARTN